MLWFQLRHVHLVSVSHRVRCTCVVFPGQTRHTIHLTLCSICINPFIKIQMGSGPIQNVNADARCEHSLRNPKSLWSESAERPCIQNNDKERNVLPDICSIWFNRKSDDNIRTTFTPKYPIYLIDSLFQDEETIRTKCWLSLKSHFWDWRCYLYSQIFHYFTFHGHVRILISRISGFFLLVFDDQLKTDLIILIIIILKNWHWNKIKLRQNWQHIQLVGKISFSLKFDILIWFCLWGAYREPVCTL